MIKITSKNIVHYGDILAVPFFFITFIYFAIKKNKTIFEIILMVFVLCGFFVDLFFTYNFLTGSYNL
jgi:hypothetical protein